MTSNSPVKSNHR